MTKRALIVAFCLLAGTLVLHGQKLSGFGLKGGLSLANQSIRFTPIDFQMDTKAIQGMALALFVETFKGQHFSFQFDVAYAVKGSSTSTHSVTVNHLDNDRIVVNEGEEVSSRFHYLSLIPLARYRFELEQLSPYVLLGPRVDFLLNYGTESEYPLESQSHTILGLTAGGGLEFRVQSLGVFAEFLYQPDLSPVSNQEPLLINNNMLSVSLGIRFSVSE